MTLKPASGKATIFLALLLTGCATSQEPPPEPAPENPGENLVKGEVRESLEPVSAPPAPNMTNGGLRQWSKQLYERLGEANNRIKEARGALGLEEDNGSDSD